MKVFHFVLVASLAAAGALGLSGCICVSETEVADDPRAKVSFESDRAARVFYEALASTPLPGKTVEKRSSVSLVLVNVDSKTVTGPNRAYNQAVLFCDSDGNGEITEHEAGIFAAEWPRHQAARG